MRLAEAESVGFDEAIVRRLGCLSFQWGGHADSTRSPRSFDAKERQEFPFRGAVRRPEPGET